MTNEFKHASVGSELSQSEWEAVSTHIADGQTTGDILYFDGTYWKRRPFNIGVRVYSDANMSIADNTWTSVTFNQERWDTDTIHDNSTNNTRLTCKTAGLYIIVGNLLFDTSANGYRGMAFLLNGITYIGRVSANPRNGGTGQYHCFFSANTIYQLAVNDYVELQAYQNSGGALNLLCTAQYGMEFMMQRIG